MGEDSKEFHKDIDNLDSFIETQNSYIIDDDTLICECNCVSAKAIRDLVNNKDDISIELLSRRLKLGIACKSCVKAKDSWIDNLF